MRRRHTLVLSIAVIVLAVAPTALGKGGKPAASTAATLALSAGPYAFGGSLSASTGLSVDLMPWITMSCTQNGAVVGTASHAGFPGGSYFDSPFNLGPSMSWTGGAADCTFSVVHLNCGKLTTDASTTVHVDA